MDEEINRILIGLIILVLIINTTQIWSLSSSVYGQNSAQQTNSSLVSGPSGMLSNGEAVSITTQPSPIPTVPPAATPVQNAMSSQNIISPFVTVEQRAHEPDIRRTSIFYEPEKTGSSEGNFITLFSFTNESFSPANMPSVSFPLVNPPLIIDYTVYPLNITDIKYIEYKLGSTPFNGTINITRPYEESWFQITVRDKDTDETVIDEGFGKTHAMISSNRLELQKSGNYIFEFSGDFVKVTLAMKVEKEGNIP
jgi:hypothetical protein